MTTKSESSIVSKCGNVLDIVSAARRPLTFKDITAQSGLAKSSAHRIITILINEQLIEHDKLNRVYRYGPRLNRWARGAWMQADLYENSAQEMHRLANSSQMNTQLSVLDGDAILYLRTLNTFPVNYASHPGDHAPLHCTAAGKVFMACMTPEQREEMLVRLSFERLTENTIQDPIKLVAELELTRSRNFGLSVQEEYPSVIGIAAPIRDIDGEVSSCLSLWTSTDRMSQESVEALAPELIASADRISR